MTRASKRKSDHQTSASVKSARVDSVRSGIVWAAQFFFFLFLFFFYFFLIQKLFLYSELCFIGFCCIECKFSVLGFTIVVFIDTRLELFCVLMLGKF